MLPLNFFETIRESIYNNFIDGAMYKWLLSGLKTTLIITVFATLMGVILGIIVAVAKVLAVNNKKLKPIEVICNGYLTFFRGTPVMVQLLLWFLVIMPSVPSVITAIVGFGVNSGAYVAEIVRAGIMGVDKGQTEAGRSLGLSSYQTMRYIVFPQAFKNMLPALCNEFIALLKETSIVGYIGMIDLTKASSLIGSRSYDPFPPLIVVALVYLVLVVCLTKILGRIERRLRESDAR